MIPDDIYELFGEKVISEIDSAIFVAEQLWGKAEHVKAAPFKLNVILKTYQRLQGREVWKHYGSFIEKYRPSLGPGVKERFEFAHQMSSLDLTEEEEIAQETVSHLNSLLTGGKILLLPTLPGCGLKRDASEEAMNAFRSKMSASFCLGGLAGLPWITLPLAQYDHAPMGVSVVGRFNSDAWLLSQSKILFHAHTQQFNF